MVAGPPGLAARWITTRRLAPHPVGWAYDFKR